MKLEFWGVRGTAPVSGKNFVKYGGHTPCAAAESSAGDMVIVDAGTGIRRLGESLMARSGSSALEIHLLLSHFHLDHIIGLPFFAPLYSAQARITFYSHVLPKEAEKWLSGLMAGRYFPVGFRETASQKDFQKVEEESFSIGKLRISHCPLNHPQGSLAYCIAEKDAGIVFATDTEPPDEGMDERLAGFIRGASYFVCDATFTPEEYPRRQGWGHSTWQQGTELARAAGVRNLLLSHLNPEHDDRAVDEIVRRARREFRRTAAAREGLRLII
jgi:phosphoribosyl 1,2-cyclic phosphodiesterase